jgi:hypothetical protein
MASEAVGDHEQGPAVIVVDGDAAEVLVVVSRVAGVGSQGPGEAIERAVGLDPSVAGGLRGKGGGIGHDVTSVIVPDRAGRRPSNPSFLLLLGAVWIICGVVAAVQLTAGWKVIPAVFFIGVGVLFLRGALVTLSRRDR